MQIIAVSQRVDTDPRTGERRDGLDQAWARFLAACGCLAWPVPNTSRLVEPILDHALVAGVLLTGGNDLVVCGGSATAPTICCSTPRGAGACRCWACAGACR